MKKTTTTTTTTTPLRGKHRADLLGCSKKLALNIPMKVLVLFLMLGIVSASYQYGDNVEVLTDGRVQALGIICSNDTFNETHRGLMYQVSIYENIYYKKKQDGKDVQYVYPNKFGSDHPVWIQATQLRKSKRQPLGTGHNPLVSDEGEICDVEFLMEYAARYAHCPEITLDEIFSMWIKEGNLVAPTLEKLKELADAGDYFLDTAKINQETLKMMWKRRTITLEEILFMYIQQEEHMPPLWEIQEFAKDNNYFLAATTATSQTKYKKIWESVVVKHQENIYEQRKQKHLPEKKDYEILGLKMSQTYTERQIHKAFLKISAREHPDKKTTPAEKEIATKKYEQILAAKEILTLHASDHSEKEALRRNKKADATKREKELKKLRAEAEKKEAAAEAQKQKDAEAQKQRDDEEAEKRARQLEAAKQAAAEAHRASVAANRPPGLPKEYLERQAAKREQKLKDLFQQLNYTQSEDEWREIASSLKSGASNKRPKLKICIKDNGNADIEKRVWLFETFKMMKAYDLRPQNLNRHCWLDFKNFSKKHFGYNVGFKDAEQIVLDEINTRGERRRLFEQNQALNRLMRYEQLF